MDADIVQIPPLIHLLKKQKPQPQQQMYADIVKIPPLIHLFKKQKPVCQAILHDVIDIDDDDSSDDLVLIGEKVSKSNKGKTIEAINQIVEVSDYTFCHSDSGIRSPHDYPLVSHNLINVDGHGSDLSYDNVDEYALIPTHLDNADIPLGTEAPFTGLPEYDLALKKSTFKTSPCYDMQSDAKNSHVMESSQPSWSLEPSNSKIQGSTVGSSNLQIKMDNVDHSSGTELSSPQLFSQAASSKKKSAASQCSGRDLNLQQKTTKTDADIVEIPPPIHLLKKQKLAILHDVIDIDDDDSSDDLVLIGEKVSKSNKGKTIEGIQQIVEGSDYTFCQPDMKNFGLVNGIESSHGYPLVSAAPQRSGRDLNLSLGVESSTPKRFLKSSRSKVKSATFGSKNHGLAANPEARKLLHAVKPPAAIKFQSAKKAAASSSSYHSNFIHGILRKVQSVKQFDTINDASGHHFIRKNSSIKQAHLDNDMQSDAKNSHVMESSQPSWSLEPSNSKIRRSTMGSSNFQIKMDNVDHSSGTELSSPQLFSQAAPSKKKSAASQRSGRDLNLSLGVESSTSKRFLKSSRSKMKSTTFGSKNHGLAANPEARKLLHAVKPPATTKFKSAKKAVGSSSSYHSNFIHGILRKVQSVKQFDTVNDTSGHHFIRNNSSMKQAHLDNDMQSGAKNSHVTESSQPSWSLEPSKKSKIRRSTMGSSNLQIKMDNVDHSSGIELSSPQLFSQAAPSKKKSAASLRSGRDLNLSLGVESSTSKRFLKSSRNKMKSATFGSKNHGLAANPEARKLLHAVKPPAAIKFKSAKKVAGSSSSYHSNFIHGILRKVQSVKQLDTVNDTSGHHFIRKNSSMKQAHLDNVEIPLGTEAPQPSWSLVPSNSKIQGSTMGSSNLQIIMDNVDHSSGTELSLFCQAPPS